MTIIDFGGIPSGSVGRVDSKWLGTTYVIRLPDGKFQYLNSSEFGSKDPAKYSLDVGDIGEVISGEHNHDFAKLGDRFQIVKVIYDGDYYKVNINNKLYWIGGQLLAKYIPPAAP